MDNFRKELVSLVERNELDRSMNAPAGAIADYLIEELTLTAHFMLQSAQSKGDNNGRMDTDG